MTLEALAEGLFRAGVRGLNQGASVVRSRAAHLAPIRNIFSGDRYTIRYKTASEMEVDRSIRGQLGLSFEGGPENPRPKTIRAKSPLRSTDPGNRWAGAYGSRPTPKWRERRMDVAQQHLDDYDHEMTARKEGLEADETMLHRRGAYEVRSKRSSSLRWGHAYIGGKLRRSIRVMRAQTSGYRADAWVLAGDQEVDYARYMEFGTRHAAAHPFMRPATAESREEVIGLVRAAVAEAARTSGSGAAIEIVVRL